ncbi:MAG: hypothetical protein M5U34_46125 [Chloroflexi bacterium]|nr:hypothetical protein [Chloroflexota bacterium]
MGYNALKSITPTPPKPTPLKKSSAAILQAGAHYEMSPAIDVDIARIMIQRGPPPPEHPIIRNGLKPSGSQYATNLISLKHDHDNLIPVIEDLAEIPKTCSTAAALSRLVYAPKATVIIPPCQKWTPPTLALA